MDKEKGRENIQRLTKEYWPLALPLVGGLAAISAVVILARALKRRADSHKQAEIDKALLAVAGTSNPAALMIEAAEALVEVDGQTAKMAERIAKKIRGPSKDAMEVLASNAQPRTTQKEKSR